MKINKHMQQVNEIKDRGRTKWTALMLPEHLSLLREWAQEDKQMKRPELDDFDLRDIQNEIDLAFKSKSYVVVKAWEDSQITEYIGPILEVNLHRQSILIEDPYDDIRIPVTSIVSIRSID